MKILLKPFIIAFISVLTLNTSAAQQSQADSNKGKMYVLWGWNWGYYSNSDIHFEGNDYNFTLEDVEALDRQSTFDWDVYFNPATVTIPQTNFRVGYYVSDNWNISLGVDHMKYFVVNPQTVKITGVIDQTGTSFDGSYDNDDIVLTKDFLQFEHSDGLNYITAEASYVKDLLDWVGHPKKKLQIYLTGGAGIGFLLPKTNSTLMGMARYDDFNVAGYGMSLKAGVNITVFKYFFIQSELKGGYINMPNIRTTLDKSDSASQDFFYLMPDILIGAVFKIAHK